MADNSDYADDDRDLASLVKDAVLVPVHAATSKTARRAYITSALLFIASLILLALAVVGYAAFYYAYVPTRGFTKPIYLQFDAHGARTTADLAYAHPWGMANIERQLASRQRYDVSVILQMPRTERNLHAGNFMLDLTLYSQATQSGSVATGATAATAASAAATMIQGEVLAKSTRPAILKYRSFAVDMAYRVMRLPLYIIGWTDEEDMVKVGMLEGIWFDKGWRNLPGTVKVEVKSREWVQVYQCWVKFDAKLSGLRYIMHYHRIISFFGFTALFWAVEMGFLLTTWAILSFLFFPQSSSSELSARDDGAPMPQVKSERASAEPSDMETTASLSDTSRTFPTLSGLRPLHYSSGSQSKAKKEEDSESANLANVPVAAGETTDVEDEDEDADFVLDERVGGFDSGLGTSLESTLEREVRREGFRRRRSGGSAGAGISRSGGRE